MAKRILIVSPRYPFPSTDGFSARLGDMSEQLATGFEQHLLVFTGDPVDETNFANKVLFKSVTVCTCRTSTGFGKLKRRIKRKLAKPHFTDPIYSPQQLLNTVQDLNYEYSFDACIVHSPLYARCFSVLPATVLKVIDAHDIWHEKYKQFASLGYGALLEHFRDEHCEIEVLSDADLVLGISLHDYGYLCDKQINALYVPVSFIPRRLDGGSSNKILMAGGNGPPNIDAVRYFLNEIYPIVKKSLPTIQLTVLSAAAEIIEDYANDPSIDFPPFIDDLSDAYRESMVVIAPLRIGSGLKIKVLECFAYGKPIILSPIAAQGIPIDSYAQKEISIAPDIFAGQVVKALTDENYRKELSETGLKIIEAHYNAETVYRELIAYLRKT